MTVRDFATFETDIESLAPAERTDEASPPGRMIAEHLVSRLRETGAHVSHEVSQWESYGWEFAVRSGEATISCMLQASDTWLLITWPARSLVDRLRGRAFSDQHEAVRRALEEVLTGDPAIRRLRWYTRSEFQRGATG